MAAAPRVHRCAENISERFRADANVREHQRCFDLLRGASIGSGLTAQVAAAGGSAASVRVV
jgi:hypothetical protein